jgi:hypothetical protein
VVELGRLAKAAGAIQQRGDNPMNPVAREAAWLRPGWVYEVVVAVLKESDQPLRPQDVIKRAERLRGHHIAPSSIRNCLRTSAERADTAVVRVDYGRYRLRQ